MRIYVDVTLQGARNEIIERALIDTGAEILVSSCPFCERNLIDAVKEMGAKIEYKDILELVNENLA